MMAHRLRFAGEAGQEQYEQSNDRDAQVKCRGCVAYAYSLQLSSMASTHHGLCRVLSAAHFTFGVPAVT